jgi:hypothetical protein
MNFINSHNNVFVLYIKVVSEMKKLSHNLNVQTKFTVYLAPEFKQNQCGSVETASSGWR